MSTLSVNTSFNINLQFSSAPVHIRFFAWIIDIVFFWLYYFIVYTLADKIFGVELKNSGLDILIYIPIFCYHLIFEILNHGQSLGKMALGIRVVSMDGKEESNTQAMVRWLMRTVDFGGILLIVLIVLGFTQLNFLQWMLALCNLVAIILFLTSKYNQRLGDMAAGTVVVYKRLPYDLNDTIFRDLHIQDYKVQFPKVMQLSDNDINIIDHAVKRHRKSSIDKYVENIAAKVQAALGIETDMEPILFLETLLNDYNYLSRK